MQSDPSLYLVGMPGCTFCCEDYLVDGYQVLCSRMLEVIKHPTADTNDNCEFRAEPLFLCRNPMSRTFAKTTAGERLYGNSPLCPYQLLGKT